MAKFKSKHCSVCDILYQPTGPCSKYCPECAPAAHKTVMKKAVHNWAVKMGIFKGVGSGSKIGKEASNYKHGRSTFLRWAREKKETLGYCEECGKYLRDATHYEWVGHHKDHDPTNNVEDNLVLLCKRCHQIEHRCWKAFEGVTTIPDGSRADNSSKRTPPSNG